MGIVHFGRAALVAVVMTASALVGVGPEPAKASHRMRGADALVFPANSSDSTSQLRPGAMYHISASGVFTSEGYLADPECVYDPTSRQWVPHMFGTGNLDRLDVVLNATHVTWKPHADVGNGCSASHTYELVLQAVDNRGVHAKVDQTPASVHYRMQGELAVTVTDLQMPPDSVSENSGSRGRTWWPLGYQNVEETYVIDSREPTPPPSETESGTFLAIATGVFRYGAGWADAECAAEPALSMEKFTPHRFQGIDGDPGSDILDLVLLPGSRDTDWQPVTSGAVGCDPHHTYWARLVVPSTGAAAPSVLEISHGHADNLGHLSLTLVVPPHRVCLFVCSQ